jgi:microcystin-dependent protein
MANYVKATNFTAKDSLPTGNSGKIVKGAEIDTELSAVANAIASKADINSPNLTGTPTAPTASLGSNTTQLATTAFVAAGLVSSSTALVPTGIITLWYGSIASIPSGWLLCNGANSTPDLRDRFVVGAGTTYAVGATGGANTVTLDATMIPAHTHTFSATTNTVDINHSHTQQGTFNSSSAFTGVYDSGHAHNLELLNYLAAPGGGSATGFTSPAALQTAVATANLVDPGHFHATTISGQTTSMSANNTHSHTVSGTTGNGTGGGLAHENRPPYYALAYIMKT